MDERIAKELHIGEELLWEDTPGVSDILNVSNIITMPIGFMMCFFAIRGIVLPDTHWKIRILLIFLLYVGLEFSVCVIYRIQQLKKTVYALTSERLLVFQGDKLTTLEYYQIPLIEMKIIKEDLGTIYLEPHKCRWVISNLGFAKPLRNLFGNSTRLALESIDNVREVYKILNDKTGDRGNIQPSPLDVFSDK